ncbi:Secretory immunoglobulin A-binding protein EsiB [Ephemeroptericola cinctiostellae]|uniref:Secretory immunoglobulin A-binding protein EsiB n=1 Tax=Ephemeroptericola cinctiostellae TaxID=2268024 RepID=A0A345D7R9_9BURK|nr:alpha/beta hydrolase-fold protein [Ephemeroptericola cinctiostellae]AXF84407.1 Secretory immunoglobulin A-binding protein EsiB [Ephemeroptericola cinctiostellae]
MKHLINVSIAASIVLAACTSTPNNNSPQKTVWGNVYGGADKSFDSQLLLLREQVAPKFQTLTFTDPATGLSMDYSLFVPKDYDPAKKYPLVMFIADASTAGLGAMAPLKQGYGGIIWATDAEQAKHPSFVLVPAFKGQKNAHGPNSAVNDDFQVSPEVDTVYQLLNHVVGQYSIDHNRLYATGQSMGGMISFYLNANHPDLFAASLFVSSQWDIKVLEPLAKMKFFYVVSKGDEKASGGMKEVGDMLKKDGVNFGSTEFAANLSDAEQEQHIESLLKQGNHINFVQFTANTVAPQSYMKSSGGAEHMYAFDHAYLLSDVRDWLFQQNKESPKQSAARQMLNDGLNYFNGTGVAQDYAKAAQLFQTAWQGGDMKAPRYLGIMAEEGLGVAVNYAEAATYYQAASNAGDITAAARMGALYEKGLGVQRSIAEALKWYLKAASTPEEAAQNIHPRVLAVSRLGYFYEKGVGVQQDLNQAKRWYRLAAMDHDHAAMAALKRLP